MIGKYEFIDCANLSNELGKLAQRYREHFVLENKLNPFFVQLRITTRKYATFLDVFLELKAPAGTKDAVIIQDTEPRIIKMDYMYPDFIHVERPQNLGLSQMYNSFNELYAALQVAAFKYEGE